MGLTFGLQNGACRPSGTVIQGARLNWCPTGTLHSTEECLNLLPVIGPAQNFLIVKALSHTTGKPGGTIGLYLGKRQLRPDRWGKDNPAPARIPLAESFPGTNGVVLHDDTQPVGNQQMSCFVHCDPLAPPGLAFLECPEYEATEASLPDELVQQQEAHQPDRGKCGHRRRKPKQRADSREHREQEDENGQQTGCV